MGDDNKNTTVVTDSQGGSAESADSSGGAAPKPAHEPTNTAAPSPPMVDKRTVAATNDHSADTGPGTPAKPTEESDKKSSADDTVATAAADDDQEEPKLSERGDSSKPVAIVASSKKERPPYNYDPNKITLRFIFANRDGLTVTVECKPSDTVGEVKGALLSVWPNDLPDCAGGELLRLVCMGKGFLMPDTRTLEDCQIPVFKTHPTPINVSVKPNGATNSKAESTSKSGGASSTDPATNAGANAGALQSNQGCACVIL